MIPNVDTMVPNGGAGGTGTATVTTYTFATLPASPSANQLAVVTDATVSSWGAVVNGGGGVWTVLIWYANPFWVVIGVSPTTSQSDAQPAGMP